jgi:hypothetical protein
MRAMISLVALLCAAAVAYAYAPGPDALKKPTKEDVEQARKVVDEALGKAQGATVEQIDQDALFNTCPNYIYYSIVFRQGPVARPLPEGFSSGNVYAVPRDKDAKPQLLNDAKKLEEFCKKNFKPVTTEDQAKDATRAWLYLAPVLQQDGFYTFALMDDSTKVEKDKTVKSASGKVVVMKGGNGDITVTLNFDDKGMLSKIEETDKLTPGPRPICQATKLLDSDDIVRRMAEQDLLIMGSAAKDYIMEQRAKASPELQKAIDRMWQRIVDEKR